MLTEIFGKILINWNGSNMWGWISEKGKIFLMISRGEDIGVGGIHTPKTFVQQNCGNVGWLNIYANKNTGLKNAKWLKQIKWLN